jgi:NAD(P)-dependent dehydrogenase (short-subunit alcohol dehydrogenase family)
VQLIVNTKDKYVRPYGYDETARWVPRLWRRDIKAGHFSPMSHPRVMAAAVHDFADLAEGKEPSRALRRGQVGRPREYFGDTLVSVTGAGSGIGRETAFAFAREGAEVVISDIDEATVKETPAEQFDRVLDINLGGVVNGCRAFGRRLVERGTGGHIVNVSSMAAYAPLQSMSAYCTSKAATFMFSDCLRAELDAAGIGLTTICPGVINTNIISATRFDAPSGKDDEHVDGRRDQIGKMFGLRHYGPDKVASAILSAVKKGKPIRPVTPEAYALYGISRVLPQALRSTARMRVI